jgi:type IV secretion system protein VirD4
MTPRRSRRGHWNEEAKALIAGILLGVVCDPQAQGEDRTLEALRDCLTFAPDNFKGCCGKCRAAHRRGG